MACGVFKINFKEGCVFFLKNGKMKRRCCFNCFVLSAFCVVFACALCAGDIIYVDDNAPNDPDPNDPTGSDLNECGSFAHPFDTIQEAIDAVEEGNTIEVLPGSYPDADPNSENQIDFAGKNCVLRSTDPNDWDVVNKTIINGVVLFDGSEDPNCKLLGFKIYNINHGAVSGRNTQATISNCNISGNATCHSTVLRDCDGLINNCLITDNITSGSCTLSYVIYGCEGTIRNCTIANNITGAKVGSAKIENTIIYNNQNIQLQVIEDCVAEISYCNIQGDLENIVGDVIWGSGNLDVDPCFASLGQWDINDFQLDEGDYHLKSFGWRIDEENPSTWVFDQVTSRCIDAGNPGYSLKNELMAAPNDPENDHAINIRINMGAYGGTHQASLGPYNWSLLADMNNDGVVDFEDISLMAEDWLIGKQKDPGDLDRNGVVNMKDYALLGRIWQKSTNWAQ